MKNENSGKSVKQNSNNGETSVHSLPLYRNRKVMMPVLGVVAVLVIISFVIYFNLRNYVSTDDAYVDGNKVTISSQYLDRISKIYVDEGDTVTQGQLVVELDNSDLKAQREQAKASLQFAEENYNLSGINLSKAEEDFARAKQQFKNNVITKEQFDHAQKALEAAKAQRSIAQAQISSAKAELGVIDTQLSNLNIVSPMDGVVAKKWAMPGDVVQMAQPILSVYDLKNLWVTANLEETKYSKIKQGEKVIIRADAYKEKKFEGHILETGSNTAAQFSLIPPNNAAGNFTKITQRIPIKISIDGIENNTPGDKYHLVPGMSVEVRVRVK